MRRFWFGEPYRAVEEGIDHVLGGILCLMAFYFCGAILAFAAENLGRG